MKLAEWIGRFPMARLAGLEDNHRIQEFLEQAPMHTESFDLRYRRQPDFFKLPHYQSDRVFVILGEDERGIVKGLGTLSLRPGWMDGRPVTVGYMGDLRIARNRVASRVWRDLFLELLRQAPEIEELADCSHWYTVLLDANAAALAALRGPGQPRLRPIGPFRMRNIVARLPLPRRRIEGGRWSVFQAQPGQEKFLEMFFEGENRHLPFGFRGEFSRRLSRWDGFSIRDFTFAADVHGVAGCMACWSPERAKQTLVSRIPSLLRVAGRIAGAWPSLKIRLPRVGEPLHAKYLTHLTFAARLSARERIEVFRRLIHHLFDQGIPGDPHCVSLCDFEAWNLDAALGGFIRQSVPITVYAVEPPSRSAEDSPAPATTPPAFEMALV